MASLEEKRELLKQKLKSGVSLEQKKELLKVRVRQEPSILERVGRGIVEGLPAAGATVGGIVGSAAGPAGTLIGAGAGGVAGEGLRQQAQSMFFPEAAPKTKEEAFTRQAKAGAFEAAGEGVGGLVGKGLARGARKLFPAAKEGAQETIEAAQRLGVKPTKGQITQSKLVQGLESSLEQSPTLTGAAHRSARGKIEDALTRRVEKISSGTKSGLSKFEVGEGVKQSISDEVTPKITQARSLYKSLEDKFADQVVSPDLLVSSGDKLKAINSVRLQPKSPAARLANEFADDFANVRNVSDLKELRTAIGNRYKPDMDKATREVVDAAYDELTDLRRQSLVFDSGSRETVEQADKLWKEVLTEIKDVDKSLGGRPSKSPHQFLEKLDKFEGSDIPKKLFQAQKVGSLKALKARRPEVFKALGDQRVNEIIEKSQVKGELNARKFVREVGKLPRETKRLLFGDENVQALKDVETLINAFPDKIGPSGTPQGIDFLSPTGFLKEARDIVRVVRKKAVPSGLSKAEQQAVESALKRLSEAAGLTAAGTKVDAIDRRKKGK